MYRKGGDRPVNANIKNVGLQTNFYTLRDDGSLDRKITRAEQEYGTVLSTIRSGQQIPPEDHEIVRRLMANCLVRTARVRTMLGSAGVHAQRFFARLSGDTSLFRDVLSAALEDEAHLLKLLRDGISAKGLPVPADTILLPLLRRQVSNARRNFDSNVQEFVAQSKRAYEEVSETSPLRNAETMHIRALESSGIEPEARRRQIAERPFGLATTKTTDLLLGDCVVIGIGRSDRLTAIDSLSPIDELKGWIMPITTRLFAFSGPTALSTADAQFINDASIRLSEQFFVTKRRSDDLAKRMDDIGSLPNAVQSIPWDDIYSEVERRARDGEIHRSDAPD